MGLHRKVMTPSWGSPVDTAALAGQIAGQKGSGAASAAPAARCRAGSEHGGGHDVSAASCSLRRRPHGSRGMLLCLLCLQRMLPLHAAAAAAAANRGRGAVGAIRLRLRGGGGAAASDNAAAGADAAACPIAKQLKQPGTRTLDGQRAAHAAGVAAASVPRLCASAVAALAQAGVSVLESAGGFVLGVFCQLADGLRDFVSVYVDGAVAYKDGGLYGMLMWAKGEWDRADEDEDEDEDEDDEPAAGVVQPGRGPGTRDEGAARGEAIEAVQEAQDDEKAREDGSDGSETAAAESQGDAAWTEFVRDLRDKLGTDIDKGAFARKMQPPHVG